ncbi:hypothetical protein KIPB_013040, partial [Kipferlia bialata]|eukprot:g13040.t1
MSKQAYESVLPQIVNGFMIQLAENRATFNPWVASALSHICITSPDAMQRYTAETLRGLIPHMSVTEAITNVVSTLCQEVMLDSEALAELLDNKQLS